MTEKDARTILKHLKDKGLSFCWTIQGRFITRTDCRQVLNIELNLKDYE